MHEPEIKSSHPATEQPRTSVVLEPDTYAKAHWSTWLAMFCQSCCAEGNRRTMKHESMLSLIRGKFLSMRPAASEPRTLRLAN